MKSLLLTLILLTTTFNYSQEKKEKTITYLALGDSYTIGESVSESKRFPVQLAEQLKESGYNIDPPTVIAKTGWTTDELSAVLDEKEPLGEYDFVTLLIGVNNQYRCRSAEEFRGQFITLLKRAAGYTASTKNVIVISIPDWGVTPFATKMNRDPEKINKEIHLFNSIKKEETQRAGATFVNIADISKMAGNDKSLLAEDQLHPSARMYELWVKRILPVAKSIIEKE